MTPSTNPARDGWKLVPVEPTKAMMDAVDAAYESFEASANGAWCGAASVYRAMIDAAPALENGPAGLADATNDPTDLSSLRKGAEVAVDEIVTRIYRRFKDWSERKFSADDVTWCEVKADVLGIIALVSGSREDG